VPRGFPDRHTYLRLDLGEEDTPASERIGEVLRALPDSAYAHYPDPWPLRLALSSLHGVPPEWVSVCAGTDEAMRLVFDCFVEEGARVLLPRPSAGAYVAAAQAGGAFVDRVDFEDDLSFPLEAFRRQLLARTPRLAVIGNPGSPTGTALAREEILALAAESPSTLFLVDEVYVSYHGRSLLDPEVRVQVSPNVLVMRSFSKDHGLAGLRVGYLVGRPELLKAIAVVKPSYTIAVPSLHAALTAVEDMEAMEARVAGRKALADRLVAALSVRGLEARATRAAFVLIRLTPPVVDWAAAFAAHKVLVGTRGHVGALAPFVRVTVTSDDDLDTFLAVLDSVLAQGIAGSPRVEAMPGDWDETGEGMA
jgi:histidinol-phosphate aminotransferase